MRACVVAPTSSRFGKGTICVLRTQGGVRWTPQKVIKEHESHKFSKMITVLYASSYIDCRTAMASFICTSVQLVSRSVLVSVLALKSGNADWFVGFFVATRRLLE